MIGWFSTISTRVFCNETSTSCSSVCWVSWICCFGTSSGTVPRREVSDRLGAREEGSVLDVSGCVVLGICLGIVVAIGAIAWATVVCITEVCTCGDVVSGGRVVGVIVVDGSVLSGSTVVVDCCTLGDSLGCSILVETSTGTVDVVAVGTGRGSVVVVVTAIVVVLASWVVVELVEVGSGRVDVDVV